MILRSIDWKLANLFGKWSLFFEKELLDVVNISESEVDFADCVS